VGSIPAWYAPKASGFASPAGSSINLASSSLPSNFAARPSYPPNFPGYPTFGTQQPVGVVAPKSGGIPYSFSTTYKPKTTTGSRPKPTGKSSNLDYLTLMKKKKSASSTTTTSTTAQKPSTTRRRKLPTKRFTVISTRRNPTTTTKPTTTVRPTTTEESGEWESLEIVEKAQMTSTMRPLTSPSTRQTTSTERKEEEKK
ncbi:hypothetical protein PENTCL1PPCAC_3620, partial [Pristionchus entomophagus]